MAAGIEMCEAGEVEVSEEEISALVVEARAGSEEAFERVIGFIQQRLHRQALFLARDEQQALDLLQETMLQAWKHLGRFDGRARFLTWVCSIMAHRHFDWRRKMRHRALVLFGLAEGASREEERPTPVEVTIQSEYVARMRECLEDLPMRQRMVLYLRFYADESLEGIAATLNCSVGTVKSRLFHGLQRLSKMQKVIELRKERSR